MKKCASLAAVLLFAFAVSAHAADIVSVVTGGLLSASTTQTDQTETAQETAQSFTPSDSDMEANSKRLAEVEVLLAEWERLAPEEAAARFGVTPDDVTNRVTQLTSLKNSYPRIESSVTRKSQDDAELQKLKADTTPPELSLTDKPPFSLSYHDSFVDALEDIRKRYNEEQENAKRTRVFTETLKKQISEVESAWRLARDNCQKSGSAEDQWKMENAALELEYIRCLQILDSFGRDHSAAVLENYGLQLSRQTALQKYICKNIDLSEDGYNAAISELNSQIKKLEERRSPLTRQLRQAETLAGTTELKYSVLSQSAGETARNAARLEMEYRTADRDRCRLTLEQFQETLVMMSMRKRLWTLRYDLSRNAVDRTTIPDTIRKMNIEASALSDSLTTVQRELLAFQTNQAVVERLLDDSTLDQKSITTLKNHRAAIQSAIESCLAYTSAVVSVIAQERHFIDDLQEEFKTVGIAEKAASFWKKRAQKALDTELWQSGGYTVRLQEFLTALAIVVFGTWGAHRVVRIFSWFVARRFKFDETRRRTFERFLAGFAGIFIFLAALYLVGIPLTAFAFLGGAIAIAVGFGAQDIFKNLMAGILLTLNRTFRLGDTIEVAGISGTVADLGIRTTVIRTFDEKEVIVPNSQLIENQLVNWSLSDALLRVNIDFGVAYGTPVKKVRETLLALLDSSPKIMKNPAPWVCLLNFGDSELELRLYFWINQKLVSSLRVGSEIREAMLDLFEKEGIAMTYPHLNVNLITEKSSVAPESTPTRE